MVNRCLTLQVCKLKHSEHAGLYKGAVLSGTTVVPYLAVSFSVYDQLKAQVKEDRNTRQLWWYPIAKLGMGATASTVAQVPSATHSQLHARHCLCLSEHICTWPIDS